MSAADFTYLLVNHIPFGRAGDDQPYVAGEMWLHDLDAQIAALRAVGGRMLLASPIMTKLTSAQTGSFNTVSFQPRDHDFEHIATPHYTSLRTFLAARRRLKQVLAAASERADIVQFGPGGHPFPLSYDAWADAGRLPRRRIWIMDGGDATGQRALRAADERNPVKRFVRVRFHNHLLRFEHRAVREADLVFAHNRATPKRFARAWGPHCHVFDRSFVTDEMLIAPEQLEQRIARLTAPDAGPLRLAVASRLTAIKAVDEVVQAVHTARQNGANVELDIYGDGDKRPQIEQLVDQLKLRDAVRLHGAIEYGAPLFERLRKADVLLVTNIVPELSRNLLIAMALGLGLIAYRNPGHDEMLTESGAATLTPPRDVPALAQALAQTSSHGGRVTLADHLRAGRRYVAQRTLEGCHRQRAELAAACVGNDARAEVG